MTSYIYSLRTLNDNWFEDRLQPQGQESQQELIENKLLRRVEPDISNIVDSRYDILSRIARVKSKPTYASPDDGFREQQSTNRFHFVDPRQTHQKYQKPTFFSVENHDSIPEVCHDSAENRRPLPGKSTGFGAVLNRHGDDHDQRFWNTTFEDTFGQTPAGCRSSFYEPKTTSTHSDPSTSKPAGVSTLENTKRPEGKKVGAICGESLRQSSYDPADNTSVQRAWLYEGDPALKCIANNEKSRETEALPDNGKASAKFSFKPTTRPGTKPPLPTKDHETSLNNGKSREPEALPDNGKATAKFSFKPTARAGTKPLLPAKDNETSLNIGDGAYVAMQAQFDSRGGKLYRPGTNITKGKENYYGVSIFQDD